MDSIQITLPQSHRNFASPHEMVFSLVTVLTSALVLNAPLQSCSSSRCVSRSATSTIQMINLFGNTGELTAQPIPAVAAL